MQPKSTRGVQQEEVWGAADALIAAGERPTIERVRIKIGRGSPNTVSPMLEAWFATLARRLGVAASGGQPAETGAPQALRRALDSVWTSAVTSAGEIAAASLASEREKLAQQEDELESAQQELAQREAVLAERSVAMEQTLGLVKSQLSDQASQLDRAARDLAQTRGGLATLVQERDADRHQFDEQLRTLAQERERLAQRSSANEHRLLEDLDRARQESKHSTRALERAEQKFAAEKQELERANALMGDRVNEGQLELATLRERLRGAEAQVKALEKALAASARQTQLPGASQAARPSGGGRKAARTVKRTP